MSGFIPPIFSKIGKAQEDHFKKKFGNDKEFRSKTATADGTEFDSKLKYLADGSYCGSIKVTVPVTDYGKLETELSSSGTLKGKAELTELHKDAKVTISGTEKPDLTLEVEYKRENAAAVAAVKLNDKLQATLIGSLVVGAEGLAVGGEAKYNVANGSTDDYNIGVQYSSKDYTLAIKTEDQADSVTGSYFHHAIMNSLDVAARAKYNLGTSHKVYDFGFAYRIDPATLFKAKASSDGFLETAYHQRLPYDPLSYGLNAKFDLNGKSHAASEYGFSIAYGDRDD